MEKKNIYFCQVDVSADLNVQSVYLPYTAGVLVAAAFASETVKKHCSFKEFIFLREKIQDVVSRLDNPAFMGFSCYSWNSEYHKALAKAVKESFPQCLIVFGGHNVADSFDMLTKYPFIDVLCHGEGEETIRSLVEAVSLGNTFDAVNNISFRKPDGTFMRTPTAIQEGFDYPSPYLDGWFDDIIDSHPDTVFHSIIETSRGCPYSCAYCDWSATQIKARFAPFEKIKNEIRWLSEHKIPFLWCADANFGVNDRDLDIANEFVRSKKETGYPEKIRVNFTRSNFDTVFKISKKFKECDFDRQGVTLSFQTMSEDALKNIGRTNLSLETAKERISIYNEHNMRCYSELILGLPGETYQSFIQGIGKLFEIGQHFVFFVYSCILIPNARMSQKDYIEKFGIETIRREVIRTHVEHDPDAIPEFNNIIIKTSTMSTADWVRCTDFYWVVLMLHANGLLRLFAIYLFNELGVPYEKFYDDVLDHFENNPDLFISERYLEIKKKTENITKGNSSCRLTFAPTGELVWDEGEYLVLNALNNFELFYEEMLPLLRSYNIPDDVFEDLLAYQKAVIRRPADESHKISFNYNIHDYINRIYSNKYAPLEKKKHTLLIKDSKVYNQWPDFAKYVVWYGRMGWSSYKDDITECD